MNSQTAPGWFDLGPSGGFLATAATIGAVVAGAAVIEAALVPGLAIGAAAVIAPRLLNFGKAKAAAKLRRNPGRRRQGLRR